MSIVHRVFSAPDLDEVFKYASDRLGRIEPNEHEQMFKSWSAPWRREALEHYAKLGWSFIAINEVMQQTVGFFLAQPFLFFRGQTQTLWVEFVDGDNDAVVFQLVDTAIRVAREKHLQRVLFANANPDANSNSSATASASGLKQALKPWHPTPLETDIAVVQTTKG